MEQWKDVVGYEGLYQVSNLGNVRRIKRSRKLDPIKVAEAKERLNKGEILRTVAEFLGTSIATTHAIKKGVTWSGDESYRPVKWRKGTDFYMRFSPCKDGITGNKAIHRTVWEAFIGPIPKGFDVNHKNLNRQDNNILNLEVISHKENCQHAHDIYAKERANLPKKGRGAVRGRYFNVK